MHEQLEKHLCLPALPKVRRQFRGTLENPELAQAVHPQRGLDGFGNGGKQFGNGS
jgi:hypothetical protein